MESLREIKCFLLDLDGTIYLGNRLIPGAGTFLETLKEKQVDYLFLTNNSSKDKLAYVDKLSQLGIEVEARQVLTSGEATTIYLQTKRPGAKVFLLGTGELAQEFTDQGFKLVASQDNPDFVVLGFDTTLTYQKLWDACDLVRDGVEYIATHPDFNCPLEGGKYMPDTGAMIAFIQASTGKLPKVMGKPNQEIVDAALTRTGHSPKQMAIVGDRLYTDIAMGRRSGLTSILVLSGETKKQDLTATSQRPDYVFSSVKELGEALNSQQ